jgi:hypothetical protein
VISTIEFNESKYHDDLMCHIKRAYFDHGINQADFYLPKHNCTDMNGAIKLAQTIHPDVEVIMVYEDDKPINVYTKNNNKWSSVSYPR